MNEQITVIAKFQTKPEAAEEFVESILNLVQKTRIEKGCLNYDFHRDLTDPTVFYMHENWQSEADLAAHFETPHLKAAFEVMPDLLVKPVEIRRLQMIDPKA